jgi:hypothetical protein
MNVLRLRAEPPSKTADTLKRHILLNDLSHIAIQATGYGTDSPQNGPFGPVTYDKNGYVGRCFEIKKFKPQDGKRYATFQIVEIEVAAEPA